MIKRIWRKWAPNPLEKILKEARRGKKYRFLIAWNRGLGDIALGLFALACRIREVIPEAEITFLVRKDLAEGFSLLKHINVLAAPSWVRAQPYDVAWTLHMLGKNPQEFDVILEKPDPTYWLAWQLGTLTPKLSWEKEYDNLCTSFEPGAYIGLQPNTETHYGYEKNWPGTCWQELVRSLTEKGMKVALFGKNPQGDFPGALDLRGKTTLLEMLSFIKNRCCTLILPDSGVLSLTYYLDAQFPLKILSLWADPKQGVLKQNVASPNALLEHIPLIAPDLKTLSVDEVLRHV